MIHQVLDHIYRQLPFVLFFIDALIIAYFLDQLLDYFLDKKKVKNEKS